MKARVTVYVRPQDRKEAQKSLKAALGSDVKFFSNKSKYFSWIGQTSVNVADQKEAFLLEREIQKINLLKDAEIIAEDTPAEEEINFRFARFNDTIRESKTLYPHPAWYHHAVKMNEALQYASEAFREGTGSFDAQNSRIDLALIDTGYSNHPEIGGIDKTDGRNYMEGEDPANPLDTLQSTRPVPIEWGGHGTSCSGVIIGKKVVIPPQNRIIRKDVYFDDLVNGLLPENVNVVPFRVSRNIISFNSKMAEAIKDVVEKTDIKIISMSHATLLNQKINYAAVREAYEKGIIIVAAPGSHIFASPKVYTYPAKYAETIAPAASTVNNVPWHLTHGGPEVDLCAPGFEIYIPWPFKSKEGGLGYVYKWSEGSSFSTPIVATAAALWRMHHGKALNRFSPTQQIEMFRTAIKQTATPFAPSSDTRLFGAGIINFEKMLRFPLSQAKGFMAVKKTIAAPKPEELFTTNKREASFMRELAYLKATQFATNQAKGIMEMDYYYDLGTDRLKDWIQRKVKNKAGQLEYLDKLLDSHL